MKWVNLWTHRPYSPFLMHLVTEATVQAEHFPKLFPESAITVGGNHWENKTQHYFYEESGLRATVDALARKTVENPDFLYVFLKTCYEKSLVLNDFAGMAVARDLKNSPSHELVDSLREFTELFQDMYAYATALPLLGYLHENPLTERTHALLREKLSERGMQGEFGGFLLALMRPVKRLQTQDQELAVLRLAARAAREGVVEQSETEGVFGQELGALQEKFGWLSFDFCDAVPWNAGYYASLVVEKAVLGVEAVEKEIESNERYEENAVREFEAVKRKLGLSEDEAALFEVVRDIGFYKWAREQVFQQATFRIKSVQDELGDRVGMRSTLESKYVLCGEWRDALKNPGEFARKAELRTQNCLMLVSREGTKLFEGSEAEREYSKMIFVGEAVDERAREFRGTPACAGSARGRVSVINVLADAGKMKQGDVLVSVATTPDLVPAMKKAVAIVTSEGGVTCHAAIVSRELGVPCVVGVRGIHKILRDGDVVEVDATNGTVRKTG